MDKINLKLLNLKKRVWSPGTWDGLYKDVPIKIKKVGDKWKAYILRVPCHGSPAYKTKSEAIFSLCVVVDFWKGESIEEVSWQYDTDANIYIRHWLKA